MNKLFLTLLMLLGFTFSLSAQDDMMKLLDQNEKKEREKVIATFKTTKVINAQSNETVHKRVLDFRVAHRFGNMGTASNGGIHTLYGLDNSSDIRIAFEYGITERLTAGVSRSKYRENLEGLVKYKILEQTNDNHFPVALTVFSNMVVTPEKDNAGIFSVTENGQTKKRDIRRLSYNTQLIVARKFSPSISAQLMGSVTHRNYAPDYRDDNQLYAVGAAFRVKVTRSMTIIADYYYTINKFHRTVKNANGDLQFFDPLGAGIEFETGGHVFSLMFTNASSINEPDMFASTTDSWGQGGYKFSFNISRNFRL
ncbi:MAG: hypothetical protein IPO27_16465 [Bacteroidetes bacterium]|nr:hypothetical protein [Bacteroidota bacterium]